MDNKENTKKKWYQKWWIWVIIFLIVVSIITPDDDPSAKENDVADNDTHVSDTNNVQTETPEDAEAPIETPVEEEPLVFELVAGEPGEYGEIFTINKDTEFEETYYVYYVPVGTYTVTNSGEYMNQFNVYSKEIHVTEEGWEEPAEVFYVKVLDVGASDTVTIEADQYIEIHEPGKFTLEKIA